MESIDTITIGPRLEATFVPADPPRASYFALWQPPVHGALDLGPIDTGRTGTLPLKPVTVDLVVGQSEWQTQFPQITLGAGCLELGRRDFGSGF